MKAVNVHEAKTHFSQLIEAVASGKEVLIAKAGKPVAKLVPYGTGPGKTFGVLKGKIRVPEDFDAPLPESVLSTFEGR